MTPETIARDAAKSVLIGQSDEGEQHLLLRMANRHGYVGGATGTGKTVTLRSLAYRLAQQGVTIFAPDVKGDLQSIAKLTPTRFWDLSGQDGDPIAVSIRDIGSTLFARLIDATEAQERVITILFAAARRYDLKLETLQDVRDAFAFMAERPSEIERSFGSVSTAAAAVIMGKLLMMEENGTGEFFGPTTFSLNDLVGGGVVNVLRAETLIHNPSLYATFLFWLLNELFSKLPEVGDADKPKLVFFFDEAHLLFQNASRPFLQKVEQVVRLIRSKGVGIYFVTQNPADIPDAILGQLGNRIQHALRAYTTSDQRGLRAAADSFRVNPAFDTRETLQGLGVGEALVSLLDERGTPSKVQLTQIAMVEVPENGREMVIRRSPALTLAVDNTRDEAMHAASTIFGSPGISKSHTDTSYQHEEDSSEVDSTDEGIDDTVEEIESVEETIEPTQPAWLTMPRADNIVRAVPARLGSMVNPTVYRNAPLVGTINIRDINIYPVAQPMATPQWATKHHRKPVGLAMLAPIFTIAASGAWLAAAFPAT